MKLRDINYTIIIIFILTLRGSGQEVIVPVDSVIQISELPNDTTELITEDVVNSPTINAIESVQLSKEEFRIVKTEISNLVGRFNFFGGVTQGRKHTKVIRTMPIFLDMFWPNSKIINLASFDKAMVAYQDYAEYVKKIYPDKGIHIESQDVGFIKNIYQLLLDENTLVKDAGGYVFTYETHVRVYNGYDKDFDKFYYPEGKLVYLTMVIFIKTEPTIKAKFLKIY